MSRVRRSTVLVKSMPWKPIERAAATLSATSSTNTHSVGVRSNLEHNKRKMSVSYTHLTLPTILRV